MLYGTDTQIDTDTAPDTETNTYTELPKLGDDYGENLKVFNIRTAS